MQLWRAKSGDQGAVRGLRVAVACAGLVVLAGCGGSGGDNSAADRSTSATPGGSASSSSPSSESSESSGSVTADADSVTVSVPDSACALSAKRVAAVTGLGYLSVAKEGPGSNETGQCAYNSPRHGTRSLSIYYMAFDSAATARTHYLAGVAANGDLDLLDVPGVGDQAWLYKRLGGPSHVNTQQQLEVLKANVIFQVFTDESVKKLPSKFDARMAALGRAIAATFT
jgi:hypothetical protein